MTYHILTLPINNSIYHMTGSEGVIAGKRLEAIRVVDNNATKLGLPKEYLSPLAKEFRLYNNDKVTQNAAVEMYKYSGSKNKSLYYSIANEADSLTWGSTLTQNMDVYVTYEYDADNTIAKLDGSAEYNLTMGGGFIAFNRGRNNRVAVFQKSLGLVDEEALTSEDFVQFAYTSDNKIPGTNIATYWQSNDNKNTKSAVAGQFHFIFKFWGSDPYNIIIGTAYNKDYTYIEKHGSESSFYYKWYKGAHLYQPNDKSGFFLASDDHKKYTKTGNSYNPDPDPVLTYDADQTGYFKSKGSSELTYNTFALLNNSDESGYVFMVSRFVNGEGDLANPDDYRKASYRYLTRDGNYNNLTYQNLTLANASKSYSTDKKVYRVQNYVYKVTKKISGTELSEKMRVSEYYLGDNPVDFIPEALKRKYVTYKAYSDKAKTNEVTTFTNAAANCVDDPDDDYPECKVIYLDYETDMPFTVCTKASPTYDDLTWYNIYVENNTKYIASWDATNSRIVTRNVAYRYPRTTHFALVGDPYDLKIVGRKSSQDGETPSTLKYIELNATLANNATFETSGTTWGIIYDDDTADNKDCFRLKDNSGDKYLHMKDASGENYPLNGTTTSSEAVRITVDELPKMNYTYYIMRRDNSIAVWTSGGRHEPSAKLDYDHIPKEIRSPFLKDVTLTFYGGTSDKATAIANATSKTSSITYAPDTDNGAIQYIVVRYDDYATESSTVSYINGTIQFNVRLNGQFIYYDSSSKTIKSKASPTDEELATNPYKWTLGGSDPYAMTVKSEGADKYVTIPEIGESGVIDWPQGDDTGVGKAITWSDDAPSSKFIIKASDEDNTYEVMGATGEGDYDAIEETFNFGRKDENTVKMYSDWKYISGDDVLRFELIATTAVNVTYHLVDIKNDELLRVQTRQESTDAPSFPPEYRSPLVDSDKYIYWKTLTDAQNKSGTHPDKVSDDDDNHIYVTYTANNLVDMSGRTTYLMKYALGDQFRQEDGSDGLLDPISEFTGTTEEKKYRYQAVYPYCNGDCNFFVYGQEQYDLQQQGAASTRTRWAWYVESVNNDPYHVKISSRQQEEYPQDSKKYYNAYFQTYAETYGGSKHVVTTLVWPGISGVPGSEYMVLGSAGQFRLVTTDAINDGVTTERRAVNSFEQYWKTWNTIRKIVLDDKDATAKQSDPNTVPATPATDVATAAGKNNRTYLTDVMEWHSYEQWAYAIRWNDYNKNGDKNKKGWEPIEHWYQTVNMGEGYFDFVKTTIDPVLILLDQHGWEIMRKPLPSSPEDPDKYEKYNAIRPYNSPMVKEYYFWSAATKATGYHKYTPSTKITVDGEQFTSTSLTSLPPFDAKNVKDAKGNLNDQYVTYTVKDEYVQSYSCTYTKATDTAVETVKPFIIQQGTHFAYNNSDAATIGTQDVPATGGMSQYIIDNISNLTEEGSKKNELWYVRPNRGIDLEMGMSYGTETDTSKKQPWTRETTEDYYQTNGLNGFDPYNIQIQSVSSGTKYFVTNATTAEVDEGSILGDGTTNTLGAQKSLSVKLTGGMDNVTLKMTDATFMAVQDEDGNIQLMPRFDHEKRLKDFSALVHTDDAEVAKTYTKLYRPIVYNYRIIDNTGNESLRYQSGGDLLPQTPDHFKSPVAKDFKYYKNLTKDEGVYTEIKNKSDISAKEITESLEGADPTDNIVYVRYSYDDEADNSAILMGNWLTMQLNEKDAIYDSGIKQGTSKPSTINSSTPTWQWKFLETPQSEPDPYAVNLYNRSQSAGTKAITNRFALLSHTSGGYALAEAGRSDYTYQFLNGSSMNTTTAATLAEESGFKSTSCSFSGTGSQVKLIDEVEHTYNYKVYTNDGKFAVNADQDEVSENNIPLLPKNIKSPLLNTDQFRYYNKDNFTFSGTDIATADTTGKALNNLYGLYDDEVVVHYTAYDLKKTEYKVPNVKTTVDGKVARNEDSNDAALDLDGELIYNIIWHNDNMMKRGDADAIGKDASHALDGAAAYVWQFEGCDPYAIMIKHKNSGKYAVGSDALAASATSTFMLLPSTDDEWPYGMLQVTGGANRLSGYGQTTTTETPTKFIIFGLSTHKVIYHLVIANIGEYENIPYYDTSTEPATYTDSHPIYGSTQRDLTTTTTVTGDTYQLGETKNINGNNVNYCVDYGHITLGDPLKVPEALKRPNCKYFFYVGGIYDDENCTTPNTDLNNEYKGHEILQMDKKSALLDKTVVINVVYAFDDGLPTNNGSNFVTSPTQKKWYTVETSDNTPLLAQYTGAWGFQMKEGRESHYTNDFLWTPVGDPYGFKMYNRYEYKTNGETTHVMTTAAAPADGGGFILGTDDNKAIYELFAGDTDGYFFMRPMLNNDVAIYNNGGTMKLSSTYATEYTFGLSLEQLKPYYDRAGYVGGLNDDGKAAYDAAAGNLQTIQGVVYDDTYIVTFTPGYYRLHSQPDIKNLSQRYLSGYTHKTEMTPGTGTDLSPVAIPMHFYEKKGVSTTFEELGATGYTKTAATQGQLPISAPEYDPASIFYITGTYDAANMSTQGLNVIENKMGTGTATDFYLMDIGGAVFLIHDNATPAERKYFCFDQTNASEIYDIQWKHDVPTDYAKWCLEPANNMGLYIETHSGGEEEVLTDIWYYSSYCVPFDMLIANKDGDDKDHSSNAYTCTPEDSPWTTTMLHPRPIGKYNTGTYKDNDYFVPAGTPVLFSTKRAKEYIKATIPTTTPSTSISTIFSYEYLEQLLSPWNNDRRVYVFGPKMEGTLNLNESTGAITAVLPSLGNTNVGFHINANQNKEAGLTKGDWTRNNYYVLHNKIYYRAPSGGARGMTRGGIDFVPVVFDWEDVEEGGYGQMEEEELTERREYVGDGCVYDMQGRRVATEEQVLDGTWKQRVSPGIYIINGKKISVN